MLKRKSVFVNRVHVPVLQSNSRMETMRERLVQLRQALGLDREEAARGIGMPKTSLQTLEDNDQAASKWIPAIALFYRVNPLWLQTGRGERDVRPIQQTIVSTGKNSHPSSRPLRLDPAILREGFVMVANYFKAAGGEFNVERDPDLLARAYEWMQGGDDVIGEQIHADIVARLRERQGVKRGKQKGQVGAAAGRPKRKRTG